jgi:pimeloyl-ACP methyl ester carboxylesterase
MSAAPGVTHRYVDLGDVLIHFVSAGAGDGPAIVLLHGWPQTWWEWRHVIPLLAREYTVIAPDLRGLGDSSRPLDVYDKKTVANDIWRLVGDRFGHRSFFLVGHDWGGPTAFALAAAHPEAVRRLVVLDVVIPGCGGDFSQGGRRWHHQFHITPDLPEALTQGREEIYLAWFFRTFAFRPDAIGCDDLAEYLPCAPALPTTVHFPRTLPTTRQSSSASSCRCRCSPWAVRRATRTGVVVAASRRNH